MPRVLALATFMLLLAAPSLATSWNYEHLGPGNAPDSYRVRVYVEADLDGQCPNHTCAWCCGGHELQISPAPLGGTLFDFTPNEQGARGSTEWAVPGGGGSFTLDLQTGQSYQLSDGRSWDAHLKYGQGAICTTSDLCEAEDTAFPTIQVVEPGVATGSSSWSTLKAAN